MKRIELLFSAILVPVDYVLLVAAGLVAYDLRFGGAISGIRPALYELPLSEYVRILLLTALGFVLIFAISGLYAVRKTRRLLDEVTSVFLACSTGVMAIMVLFFFQREFFSSRFIVLSGWILSIIAVTFGRLVVRSVQHRLLRKKIGAYRVAVIGNDATAERLTQLMHERPGLGYDIVARLPMVDELVLRSLGERHRETPVDVLLQADPSLPKAQTLQLIAFANAHHITFKYAADLFEAQATNIAVETLGGIPVIEIQRTKLEGWGRILKRAFDVVFSLAALMVTCPLLLLTACAIKLDSSGPVFYASKRIGQNGKPFLLYKFRSMVKDAHGMKAQLQQYNERRGPLFKMKNDPRVTHIGKFLRRSSIDELPQFMNVLLGTMSVVGPRPHEPEEVATYEAHQRQLMTVKPGITGLAQISGRSDLEFSEEVRLDMYYIENWSFFLDWTILLKTPAVVLGMKSAV